MVGIQLTVEVVEVPATAALVVRAESDSLIDVLRTSDVVIVKKVVEWIDQVILNVEVIVRCPISYE